MFKTLIVNLLLIVTFQSFAQIELSHNVGNELVERRIFGCSYGGMNWARAFTLQDFGIPPGESFFIESGQVGLYDTYVPVQGHVVFNIYEIDNNFPNTFDESKLIGSSQEILIYRNQTPELYDVTFDTPIVVPAGVERILVEVKQVPNFANSFVAFIASTDQGNDKSYIKSDFGGCKPLGYYTTPEDLSYDFGNNFYITVNGQSGRFAIQDDLKCENSIVDFTILGDLDISTIVWDFGDGNSSNLEKPSNVYNTPGNYLVNVIITTPTEVLNNKIKVEIPEVTTANSPGVISFCNEVNSTIDLNSFDTQILGSQNKETFRVVYFTNEVDAINDSRSLFPNHYIGTKESEIFYARVSNINLKNCYAITTFQINYFTKPVSPTITEWSICDDNQDGIYDFDLTIKTAKILENLTDTTISYYKSLEDATLSKNALNDIYQNRQNRETIHVRLENSNNRNCFVLNTFELIVTNGTAFTPSDIVICNVNQTGIYEYDLSQKDPEILNNQNQDKYLISYFNSEADAQNNKNELNKFNYQNIKPKEIIFARLQHIEVPTCFGVTNFKFIVNSKPELNLRDEYITCPESPNLIIDGGNFETYEWRNELENVVGTTKNLTVKELGNYSLSVTETKNGVTCENKEFFTVLSSGAPESFTFTLDGFSDQIDLTINAEGIGAFEYSIDGINFQSKNSFKVFPGKHTVFVRDPLNCRELYSEVIALGYQKFFTPNGDNVHEFWNIIGSELYPESQLFIYNRFGNLIAQVDVQSQGWDGTYLGKTMPSSDYWFKYQYDGDKFLTGHFSLKR